MAKAKKKVRRVEIEKVKNGDGGSMHKVTASYHESPGASGKGFKNSMPQWHQPEETYHTSPGKAKKHVHKLLGQMTASPEDEVEETGAFPENDSDSDVS